MELFEENTSRHGYWHGDVILHKQTMTAYVAKIEPGENGYVLAEGEVTGHQHKITDIWEVEYYQSHTRRYLKVNKETMLLHEEHHALTLAPDTYEVKQVREFDPWDDTSRFIKD